MCAERSGRGQGAAEAKLFAAEGATVRITDVLDDVGNETTESLGDAVSYRHHDVAAGDQWTKVMDDTELDEHEQMDQPAAPVSSPAEGLCLASGARASTI